MSTVTYAKEKSMLAAYLLWFFLGAFGLHKLYLGQLLQFLLYLTLTIVGSLLSFIALGWITLIPLGFLLFLDIFFVYIRVNKLNNRM